MFIDKPKIDYIETTGGVLTLSGQLSSLIVTGTSPLSILSTTAVSNLNADMLDGKHASDLQATINSGNLSATSPIQQTGGTGAVIGSGVTISIQDSSTSQKGAVQLSNSYSGTSQALTTTEKALSDGLATKQNTLTNPITGVGTSGQLAQFNGTNNIVGGGTLIAASVSVSTVAFNKNLTTADDTVQKALNTINNFSLFENISGSTVLLDTTNFNNILSSLEDTSQKAFDTIDNNTQLKDETLTALANLDTIPGFLVETSTDTFTKRILSGTLNKISITNADGISGNPIITVGSDILDKKVAWDGWIDANETWTYASADAPTYTFTVNANVTDKYSPSMRLKLTDVTVKYFIITAVSSYTGGNTTITVYGGTDYTLSGGAITLPYYSSMKAPFGFPLDPTKWYVELQDTSTRNTTSGTYVNVGSLVLNIPIGSWEIYAKGILSNGGASYTFFTLSTGTTTESDPDFTVAHYGTPILAHFVMKKISVAAKTPYYINLQSQDGNTASLRGDVVPTIIHATCAYL